jgi:hypothetical protein
LASINHPSTCLGDRYFFFSTPTHPLKRFLLEAVDLGKVGVGVQGFVQGDAVERGRAVSFFNKTEVRRQKNAPRTPHTHYLMTVTSRLRGASGCGWAESRPSTS